MHTDKTIVKLYFKSENREEMPYGFYFMDFYEVHDLYLSVFCRKINALGLINYLMVNDFSHLGHKMVLS